MSNRSRLRDSEKYAVLAAAFSNENAIQGTTVNHDSVGAYRTKTVRAGEFLYISCYPLISAPADRGQREMLERFMRDTKGKASARMKYDKYNNKRRIEKFEQLVHENFEKDDFHVCCTYALEDYEDYGNLEIKTREEAKNDVRNYIRRCKRMLKRNGINPGELRWISCTVSKSGMKNAYREYPERHHHHLLMHGVPLELRGEIERLWIHGTCNADRLQDSGEGFSGMAGYIARQENSANGENCGERSFSTSRNIKKPKVTTNDSRISRRRVSMIASDVMAFGSEIFEKLFEGYRLIGEPKVNVSEFVAGAYIYAKLRRRQGPEKNGRRRE